MAWSLKTGFKFHPSCHVERSERNGMSLNFVGDSSTRFARIFSDFLREAVGMLLFCVGQIANKMHDVGKMWGKHTKKPS